MELDFDEATVFMTRLFTPTMRAFFVEYDAETFGGFACVTCHGTDAADVFYGTPAVVGSLTFGDLPVEDIEDEERWVVALWMDEVVLFEVGRMFEQELTLDGASCLGFQAFDSLPQDWAGRRRERPAPSSG